MDQGEKVGEGFDADGSGEAVMPTVREHTELRSPIPSLNRNRGEHVSSAR